MSIINRKLSRKGFSLIELMVAVIILAIAVLGIFLAFSSGWMGMANARDRTVATNFARESMENVKNMDWDSVTNVNLGTAESVGAKFTRVITVNTESDNLKEVNTKVFWTNNQGQYVDVETLMYINRTLSTPREAAKLLLYADPYYSVLPSTSETIDLIAVIKDASGNTKIDWSGGNIRFNIISGSLLGSLPAGASAGVDTNGGIAETIFTPSNYIIDGVVQQGDVEIEAAVELPIDGSTISDIITITVTLGVVRVELSADPYSIDADGTSTSTVTATLVDSAGGTVEDAPNDILFAISGEGAFVDSSSGGSSLPDTYLMSNTLGIATIYVESIADTPGVATVTASSEGLLSDTLNIITTGVATFISVTVNPNLIYTDDAEGTKVTVEIQDVNGNPVEYSGDISLATSDGTGIFEPDISCDPANPNSLCFDNVSSKYTTFSSASPGIVTITASGGDLTAGNAIIEVRDALIADTIIIKAIPKNIFAGGTDVSEITATIKQGSTVISNYNNDITFEIISDTSSSQDASLSFNSTNYDIGPFTVTGGQYGSDGEVVVYLNPASNVGICAIKVSTVNSLGTLIDNTVEVGFYSTEDHIELSAVPSKMLVNGDNCTVTATVVDEGGTKVIGYNEDITFTILVGWPKIAKFVLTGTSSLTQTLIGGEITVDLIPQSTAGTVTLKASSFTGMTDIIGFLNISVNATLINLVEDSPAYSSTATENIVTFEIEVQGAEVVLGEMQVSWSPNDSETLNKINIDTNEVYSDVVGVVSGTVVDVIPTNLPAGTYTINLHFNISEVMSGKTFNIIFNPSSEYYPVEFEVP